MPPFTVDDSNVPDEAEIDERLVALEGVEKPLETMQLVKTTLKRLSSLVDVEEQGQIKELLSRLGAK